MTAKSGTRVGRLARKLLTLFASVVLALVVVEVAVRALGITVPQSDSWYPHPSLGWTDLPGHRYDYQVEGRPVTIEFNRLGFRDRDYAASKPPATRRIAIVGDSFVAAVQVNLAETFPKLLEARLNRLDPDTRWEVLSFGVGDWGNTQQLIALKELVLDQDPELILWQFFPLNDVCNNELALAFHCKSLNDGYRPYLAEDGEALTFLQPWRQRLRGYWRTFAFADRWQLIRRHRRQHFNLEDMEKIPGPGGPVSALLATYLPVAEQPEPVRKAWRTTERLIERFAGAARERQVSLAAVLIPFKARLGKSWASFKRATRLSTMGRDDADRRLLQALADQGVPGVALRACFEPVQDHGSLYVDGHLSPAAHRLAAQCIWEFLESQGLPTPVSAQPVSNTTLSEY